MCGAIPPLRLPSSSPVPVKLKAKLSLCLTKYHSMKTYGGVDVWVRAFLTSAQDGSEWSASRPGRFTPRYPLNRMLCGPQSRLDALARKNKILAPARNRTPVVQPVAHLLY
jgi:hypothetical protein